VVEPNELARGGGTAPVHLGRPRFQPRPDLIDGLGGIATGNEDVERILAGECLIPSVRHADPNSQ
jgi:hypothetical protein